jgi:propionyl-CoA carboxylase alpha chain/3-methylcrotonyl-CoA carboxylase alpha subunit/acetyl-CoA/propionyl-CoA carboxylase biotin carboxyl carrier protein
MSGIGKGQIVTATIASGPSGGWPFRRVLIANRGEIALRILRTVQALGLEAVVVYHAADAASPAVLAADRAIEITGSTPIAAYLDGAQIVAAAGDSGAGAIHPGYGFLSENAHFARQVAEAGLIFVGPPADAIELMGDKVRARAFVAARGISAADQAGRGRRRQGHAHRSRSGGAR